MGASVGFIGVGTMGGPMARNLLRHGYRVRVFDLDSQLLTGLEKDGAEVAPNAAAAASDADCVITMLPRGEHVESALFGDQGAAEAMGDGVLYINMSTILPSDSTRFALRLQTAGVAVVDAPVGRSSQHAIDGKLLIMVGGEAGDVERARAFLEPLGDTIVHCGPTGAGQKMKLVNNYMSIALNALTAEALVMAESAGLDPEQARSVMLGTVAGQGHMGTTYPAKVLKGDLTPGFMVDLAHKDMGLALAMAGELDAPAWLGAVAHQTYGLARRHGRGAEDWTAVYAALRETATGDER